jgi:hypothetical protein
MIGTEAQKASVLPVLAAGTPEDSFPPLLQGRVYADLRSDEGYFAAVFELILSLYDISPRHRAVVDLRESLEEDRGIRA